VGVCSGGCRGVVVWVSVWVWVWVRGVAVYSIFIHALIIKPPTDPQPQPPSRREARLAAWQADRQAVQQRREEAALSKARAEAAFGAARTQQEAERAEKAVKDAAAELKVCVAVCVVQVFGSSRTRIGLG